MQFQSTHPRRVRQEEEEEEEKKIQFQSTHPRRVRLRSLYDDLIVYVVSIHAPT